MGHIGQMLAASGNLGIINAEKLVHGIAAGSFARFARPGGVEVRSNHPAFILGHLSIYPQRVLQLLELPVSDAAPPASFEALFKNGLECVDDASGSHYPPMSEITSVFFRVHRTALAALGAAADERLTQPNPAEGRMRELFPTIGAALGFYVGGHVMLHLGQLSAWRRAMGMPAA